MPNKCDLCGKTPQFGHSVSHSKRHTNRRWNLNMRKATLVIEGKEQKVNICMRCLRTYHKIEHQPAKG